MRLRKLIVHGFKSFADRTEFDFDSRGLTCVVGPNGCGKSNVLDAVARRSRRQPVLLVVDDVEWASVSTMEMLAVLATGVEQLPVLLVLVANPAAGGPAIEALSRLDPSGGRTHVLAPLSDDDVALVVAADGIHDPAAVAAIVSLAAGRPGVARREAAA